MQVCANTQSPQLIETCSNKADEDLEDEHKNDLLVGLHLELREFSAGLALISHDSRIMPGIHHYTVYPLSVLQGGASQHQMIVIKRKGIIGKRVFITKVQSALKLVQLVIR